MKNKLTIGLTVAGGVALLLALTPTMSAAAADPAGGAAQAPQLAKPAASAAYAPDLCLHLVQQNPAEQKYRNVNNVPFTYDVSKFGTDWFDVACGDLTFTVPVGQQALIDLTAVAELDCQSSAASSWCGGRFLIDGVPTWPDNTGRGDSYAWDSANGGKEDWQANTLAQEYVVTCREATGANECVYKVQLQSRLENGASSVWIDDLTIRVDVTEGVVKSTTGAVTP